MAMTISEADAVRTVLQVVALDDRALQNPPTVERLATALANLDQRAAHRLQLGWIIEAADTTDVARELLQRLEDAR